MHLPTARPGLKAIALLIAIPLIALLCAACGGDVSPNFSYKAPAFLPFHISLGKTDANPTISGNLSWITDFGVISIGAGFQLPPPGTDEIYVVLENRQTGFDHVYKVRTDGDTFAAVVNGTTEISVSNNQVTIDVTKGTIRRITFKRVDNQIAESNGDSGNPLAKTGHSAASRWDEGWTRSWYHPFMLSSWAYDDSTVAKWYGIGFVWFLLRLILAIVLGVVDILFTILFFIGQLFVTLFGTSVWPGGLG